MYYLVDDGGMLVNARFDLSGSDTDPFVIVESSGGAKKASQTSRRNPDYNKLVRILFEKLAAMNVLINAVILESAKVSNLQKEDRTVQLDNPYPVDLRTVDIEEFRKLIGKKISSMHQAPGIKRLGNSQKKIKIILSRNVSARELGAIDGSSSLTFGSQSPAYALNATGFIGVNEALEGGGYKSYRQHRKRENKLRKAKIADCLAKGFNLKCQVKGCGFDFQLVYGEIGQNYAHVHHLKPLGFRKSAEKTKLEDLAIVCANCHAMIHRGKQCRPLEGLIKGNGHRFLDSNEGR